MESLRKLTEKEQSLLSLLIKKANTNISINWDTILVRPMMDGNMGSLYLFPNGIKDDNRLFGQQVSDFQFLDVDNVEVIASLNLDKNGNLFELDIWKTDFTALISYPDFIV